MAKTNINIVKTFLEAGAKGDAEAARKVLDDNIEWIEPEVAELWFSGKHYGADRSLQEVVMPTFDHIDDFGIEIDEYIDAGDTIIALGRFKGTGKETGKSLDVSSCFVCTVQNGKIVRFRAYHNTAQWLKAIGKGRMAKAA